MTQFSESLSDNMNLSSTENKALQRATTGNSLLNYFSVGGSNFNDHSYDRWKKSMSEFPLETLKLMFHFRDITSGQGRRKEFKLLLRVLSRDSDNVKMLKRNLHLIPTYGRWDDLYCFIDTPLQSDALYLIKKQYDLDLENLNKGNLKEVSLLGKWLKSNNTSSKESVKLANITREFLGLSSKEYRKNNVKLRECISIVENKLRTKSYQDIDYSKVPSQAMFKYKKAFINNDEVRYKKFLNSVDKGEEKINTGTLYPYQIARSIIEARYEDDESEVRPQLNTLWNNLPDYITNKEENSIAVVDTSGSMYGSPIAISTSLGLYLSERSRGPYKNKFITFSDNPVMQNVQGSDVWEKIRNLEKAQWDMSTNIESVFNIILQTAIDSKVPEEDMLSRLYVISDMQFNDSIRDYSDGEYSEVTLMNRLRNKFKENKVKFPELIFWNVSDRMTGFPMSISDGGFINVSGFSPTLFKSIMKLDSGSGPMAIIDEILESERYSAIQ